MEGILDSNQTDEQPRGFRALVTAAAFISLFSYAVVFTIIPASINEIRRTYNAGPSQLSWLFRTMMAGFLAAALLGGRYSDRRGKLPVLVIGCSLMCAGMLLFWQASGFAMAVFATLITGVGGGFAEGTAMAVMADFYSGPRRTALMNYSQIVFASGAVACPLGVAQLLKSGFSWRTGFAWAAVICLVGIFITLAARFSGREKLVVAEAHDREWRSLLMDPLVLCLSLGIMLYVGSECGAANWLAVYFKSDLGASRILSPWSVGVFWFGIGAGRAVAAWGSKHASDYVVIRLSLACAAVFQALLLLIHHPVVGLGLVFMLGTSLGPVWPTIISRAGAAFPRQSGTVLGIIVAAGGLGAGVLSPSIGWIADGLGMRLALWACFIMLAGNLALFLKLGKGIVQRAEG